MDFYRISKEETLKAVEASENGLTEAEGKVRLQQNGYNLLSEQKRKNPILLFFAQFNDFMTILLMIAAAISAVMSFITKDRNDLVDTIILLVIILLNNVIGFIQQYRADNAIEKMKNMSTCNVKTRRNGKDVLLDGKLLVRGDVVFFEEGDRVPADCRILACKNLKCNESALTGESLEVEKSDEVITAEVGIGDRKNMLYSSTYVVRGQATAIVVETGMRTEIGKIAGLITQAEILQTPLERALEKLGKVISIGVVIIALFLFLFGTFFRNVGLLPNFMSSIAVAVAAIPEGLPAVVTVLMAMGVQKMSKHRAIVRKLQAVETLGGCSCICSDKTGTLTKNQMTVQEIFTFKEGDEVELFKCMHYCNTVKGDRGNYIGDATEIALKNYLDNRKITLPTLQTIDEVPFDSDRKMMSVVVQTDEGAVCYSKGGAEVLLEKCAYVLQGGEILSLTKERKNNVLKSAKEMAQNALRVLGFAYRKLGHGMPEYEKELVFIGLSGMIDPPKETAEKAVNSCIEAGIDVVMITGDQRDTAFAIARRLNIARSLNEITTGEELDKLRGNALEKRILATRVFARVNSSHKQIIVKILQKCGKTVAMTGDGVNDAPAVKSADIGIAMGSGTDVTKNVADIVVADDDFSTITTAVAEGRHIFANIRKTIGFFLTTNLAEVLAVLVVTLFLYQYDFLNSTQLLWINLITDTFPVLALGAEKAEKNVMRRPPQKAEKEMFSKRSLVPVLIFGVIQAIAIISVFIGGLHAYDNATALTMAFFVMSFMELFYAFNIRLDGSFIGKQFFENKVLLVTVLVALLLNVLLCVVEPVRLAFGIAMLNGVQWAVVFGVSLAILPLGELYKLALRIYENKKYL